jgi:mannobiose 2-epimerase
MTAPRTIDDTFAAKPLLRALVLLCAGIAFSACGSSAPDAEPLPEPTEDELLANEIEEHFRTEVLANWFPRAVDTENGGFGPTFAEDWTPIPDTERFVVFQSRLTWTAAEVARRYEDLRSEYSGYAAHGLRYLSDCLADPAEGALFWSVGMDCKSSAKTSHSKHAYGVAFAIYGASALARLDPSNTEARARAVEWFDWLETHAYDSVNGGYYQDFNSAGEPLIGISGLNKLGEGFGRKGMNTHIHLMEAFTELAHAGELELVRPRLQEVYDLILERFLSEDNYVHQLFSPDWTLFPKPVSYGHDVETAFLLLETAEVLGLDRAPVLSIARAMVDAAIEHGYDTTHGGLYYEGYPSVGPTNKQKSWWTQAENLNALSLMDEEFGEETSHYRELFLDQWRFILEHQLDHVYGDWFDLVEEDGSYIEGRYKGGGAWKGTYHHGRALMYVIERLRRSR